MPLGYSSFEGEPEKLDAVETVPLEDVFFAGMSGQQWLKLLNWATDHGWTLEEL